LFEGKDKVLEIFKGNHNSKRPPEVLRKVMNQIYRFNKEQERLLQGETLDAIPDQLSPQ
jgi:hypothetical protein